jgi:hypothetical protein
MQITFDVPQAFKAGSDPVEKAACIKLLNECARLIGPNCSVRRVGSTQASFELGRHFSPDSNPLENALVLEKLLRCLTDINVDYLARRHLTTCGGGVIPLYHHPLRYNRTVVWDSIPALQARNYGDCKSLACAQVAECLHQGIAARPVFRFLPPNQTDTGQLQFHILSLIDGIGFHDPSKVKGMGAHENAPPVRYNRAA